MRHFFLLLTIVTSIVLTPVAHATQVMFQDIKLPTQVVMEHDSWAIPLGASTSYLKLAAAITNGSVTTISSFLNSGAPDYPKNITLTPTGTTANVAAGTAVVSGTSIFGKAITENFAITSTQSSATTGSKAFKTVTSVSFPAASGTGVTLSIGTGTKLGARKCSDQAGQYVFSQFNNAYETTRGTYAVSASAVESNTFTPNGSMDGAKPVDFYYIQNFRCVAGN